MIFYLFLVWYSLGFIVTWFICVSHWEREFGKDRNFMDWFGTRFWALIMAIPWPIWALGYIGYTLSDRNK